MGESGVKGEEECGRGSGHHHGPPVCTVIVPAHGASWRGWAAWAPWQAALVVGQVWWVDHGSDTMFSELCRETLKRSVVEGIHTFRDLLLSKTREYCFCHHHFLLLCVRALWFSCTYLQFPLAHFLTNSSTHWQFLTLDLFWHWFSDGPPKSPLFVVWILVWKKSTKNQT